MFLTFGKLTNAWSKHWRYQRCAV